MIYTEEQWKVIKQAAPHFESARHEYLRNCPKWLSEQVINVYEAATGKTVMHKDLSCAVCVLNIYKQIGKTYFDDLKNHQNNNFQVKLEIEKNTNEDNAKDNNNSSKVSEPNSGDKAKNKRSIKKDSKGTKQNKDN